MLFALCCLCRVAGAGAGAGAFVSACPVFRDNGLGVGGRGLVDCLLLGSCSTASCVSSFCAFEHSVTYVSCCPSPLAAVVVAVAVVLAVARGLFRGGHDRGDDVVVLTCGFTDERT